MASRDSRSRASRSGVAVRSWSSAASDSGARRERSRLRARPMVMASLTAMRSSQCLIGRVERRIAIAQDPERGAVHGILVLADDVLEGHVRTNDRTGAAACLLRGAPGGALRSGARQREAQKTAADPTRAKGHHP